MPKRAAPASSDGGREKRRYAQQAASGGRGALGVGMRGVLISCDVHLEREAIKETLRLLEGLTEEGPAANAVPSSSLTAGDALAREIEQLKEAGNTAGGRGKRNAFTVAQTGCGGNVFIRFEERAHDPLRLVEQVMESVLLSRGLEAPHVIRMLPVQVTCAAKPSAIETALKPLVAAALRGSERTYAVQWRRRCNTDVEKQAVIDAAAASVVEVAPKAKVDLNHPDTAILTEVIKTVCCVSVLPNWARFRNYNLRALTESVASCSPEGKQPQKAEIPPKKALEDGCTGNTKKQRIPSTQDGT
ncbi:MAG: hypothetical protein SGPRY_003539 [Prymnesium sp.]